MNGKTSKKSAKVAKKPAAKRVAAKTAKPREAVAKSSDPMSASKRIDGKIADLGDWRGERLAEIRKIIHEVDPEVVEEWKWMGTPVWSHEGMYALANAHKDKVKLTFFHGADLPDTKKLFNAGLDGNKWRAIDFREGDKIDKTALKALLREAVAYNATRSVPEEQRFESPERIVELLRALQEQQVERLGSGGRATSVDVRVIAATHQSPGERVQRRALRDESASVSSTENRNMLPLHCSPHRIASLTRAAFIRRVVSLRLRGEQQVGPVAGHFRLPALIVITILRSGCLTPEGLARNLGMPVHERAVGIVLPCPDVQRVEGRKPEAVRALEQVQELAHELGRRRVIRMPSVRENEKVGADEA
jgi:hypothetical protein